MAESLEEDSNQVKFKLEDIAASSTRDAANYSVMDGWNQLLDLKASHLLPLFIVFPDLFEMCRIRATYHDDFIAQIKERKPRIGVW